MQFSEKDTNSSVRGQVKAVSGGVEITLLQENMSINVILKDGQWDALVNEVTEFRKAAIEKKKADEEASKKAAAEQKKAEEEAAKKAEKK